MNLFSHREGMTIFVSCLILGACAQKPLPYNDKLLTKSTELDLRDNDKRGIIASSGIVYLVDKEKQTLTAYQQEAVLWEANIGKMNPPPVVGAAEIRFIRLEKKLIFVVYGKHCYSNVDITTGRIKDLGCD